MTRTRAVIAEDELPQRQELRSLLAEQWPELDVVAECEDGLQALDALREHHPQVLFLDIRMPGVSGLEVARAAAADCQVVFVTAYEEYAVRAFDEGAIDYLLKPVSRERLERTMERVRARIAGGTRADIAALLDRMQGQLEPRRQSIQWITASVGHSMKVFAVDEVLFFQAQEKYTRVVTADSEGHIRTTLKELAAALDSEVFWQVHRSAIVRVGAIRSVDKGDDGKLRLSVRGHAEVLPVSGAFSHRFRGM